MSELEQAMEEIQAATPDLAEQIDDQSAPQAAVDDEIDISDLELGAPEPEEKPAEDYTRYTDPNSEYWGEQAGKQGWKPLEDWVAAGNDPKDHRSPREFVERGDLIHKVNQKSKELEQMQAKAQQTFQQMDQLYQNNMKAKLDELTRKRDEAVEIADMDQFRQYQQQIDQFGQAPVQNPAQPQTTNDNVKAWEQQNQWINAVNNPASPDYGKAVTGHKAYEDALSRGANPDQALSHMQSVINQMFPPVNPNQQNAQAAEESAPSNRGMRKRSLSFRDLTSEEVNMWEKGSVMWGGDKKAFLRSVAKTRGL